MAKLYHALRWVLHSLLIKRESVHSCQSYSKEGEKHINLNYYNYYLIPEGQTGLAGQPKSIYSYLSSFEFGFQLQGVRMI